MTVNLTEAEAIMLLESVARRLDEVRDAGWMAKRERNIRLEALWSAAGKIRESMRGGYETDELQHGG